VAWNVLSIVSKSYERGLEPSLTGGATMAAAQMKVLVGVDFDRTSDDAISEGLALLSRGAACELHVVQIFAPFAGEELGPRPWFASERQLIERAPVALLLRVRALARSAGLSCDEACMVLQAAVGPTVESLLVASRQCAADVLIVGAEAHCGQGRARVGSVIAELVARGACPVLIARSNQYPRPRRRHEATLLAAARRPG
jgi:nucleotide-binding universal stress UspA family protein